MAQIHKMCDMARMTQLFVVEIQMVAQQIIYISPFIYLA